MAKKEFKYRGKTLDELKAMSQKEFAELAPSRARRSLKRGLTDQEKLFLKHLAASKGGRAVKTHCRDIIILPVMVGTTIGIHKGNGFVEVLIEPEMLGHCLGEFAQTRKRVEHHAPGVGATKSSGAMGVK